jgi:parallel beta-helix repeat protein
MPFPRFRSSFITGTDVPIQVNTTTPASTTVTKVEFFLATFTGPGNSKVTVKLGEDDTAPFSYNWTIPDGQISYNELSLKVTNSTGATAVQGGTGYTRVDVFPPDYANAKKYYVQAGANAANNGLSVGAPFNTIQKAADVVAPGDSVFVMAGTYSNGANDVVNIIRTGTAAKWIVFTNYQNDRPKLTFSSYQGFNVFPGAAYTTIQGFEIVGNNANVTLPQATTQPGSCDNPTGTVNPIFNGNGIGLNGRNGANVRPHHIVLANNVVHDCGGAGIVAIESDYVTIDNNTVYNNSWYTVFGTSGISILNAWNYDNNISTPKFIIRNNRCYGNKLLVKWRQGTICRGITDGNGIILDNNNATFGANPLGAYTGKFLVENNLCYLNGGRGINVNYTDNATVLNNTFYQNAASPEIESEFAMRYSVSPRFYNNIFYVRPDKPFGAPVNSPDIQFNNNLTFGGTGTAYFSGNQNKVGVDPQFVDAANADFQLAAASPAINAGSSTPGQYTSKDILGINRPQGAGVDIGAYELQGTPLIITQQPASSSAVCVGTTVSVSVGTSGPVQSYQWYKNGNVLTGVSSATTATLSLSGVSTTDAGSYLVVATGFNSVTSTAFNLTVNTPPTATLTPANATLTCASPSLTLTASGGTSYSFSTGETTPAIVVTNAGTYSVLVTDANGCTATATATVVSNTLAPAATLTNNGPLSCTSTSVTLTASGGESYAFSGPGLTQSGSAATASVSSAGTYSVVVTGANGCTVSAGTTVGSAVNTPQGVGLVASNALICSSPTVVLTASSSTSGVSYSFSGPAITAQGSNTATVSQAGTYSVLVTSPDGCTASASVSVSGGLTPPDAPNASSLTVVQGTPNVTLTVSNCAGTVNWNGVDGGTSLPVSTTAVGDLVYSVTCKVGVCTSPVTSVTVTVKAPPASLSVYHRDADNNQPTNNTIKPYLKLYNEGNTAIPYAEITIRYWLTVEDFAPLTNLSVYWAQLGTSNVKMKYVSLSQPRQGALGYIEYSFEPSAGNLAANSNSGEIQTGIGKQNWTNFAESDDYSFSSNGSYTKNDRITIYRNGTLAGGVEPAAMPTVTSLKIYSENKNSNPNTNQISTHLKLANEGNVPVDYSQLTVRYWFSSEGANPLVYTLDYAELGNGKINSKFVKENRGSTDTYLELSFVPTLGQLNPLSSTGIIQQRINKNDWSNFNEINDHSYKPAGALSENTKITVYLNGSLVYGQEPALSSARVGAEERTSAMKVVILGNPIQGDAVNVDVSGIEGQSLRLLLTDVQGRIVSDYRTEQAGAGEQYRLPIGPGSAGVLLLQVNTNRERQSFRLLKK